MGEPRRQAPSPLALRWARLCDGPQSRNIRAIGQDTDGWDVGDHLLDPGNMYGRYCRRKCFEASGAACDKDEAAAADGRAVRIGGINTGGRSDDNSNFPETGHMRFH